jgi:hypothetical protein
MMEKFERKAMKTVTPKGENTVKVLAFCALSSTANQAATNICEFRDF